MAVNPVATGASSIEPRRLADGAVAQAEVEYR